MNRARVITENSTSTTQFQRRLQDPTGRVVDFTRVRLTTYVAKLHDPTTRAQAVELMGRYDSADIEVAWRAGRPIWQKRSISRT